MAGAIEVRGNTHSTASYPVKEPQHDERKRGSKIREIEKGKEASIEAPRVRRTNIAPWGTRTRTELNSESELNY